MSKPTIFRLACPRLFALTVLTSIGATFVACSSSDGDAVSPQGGESGDTAPQSAGGGGVASPESAGGGGTANHQSNGGSGGNGGSSGTAGKLGQAGQAQTSDGGQGQAGHGASGDAAVIVPKSGDCPNLPPAGTWKNISPLIAPPGETSGHNYSEAIVVDPFDAATVWWGSGYGGIFKSGDCGSTWKKIDTGMSGVAIDGSAAGSMAVDPLTPGVMYSTAFQGANGLFKSVDGGVDWKQLTPPGSPVANAVPGPIVNSVAMEAANPKHLVISMHEECMKPFGPICEAESTDGGDTWTLTRVPMALTGGYAAGAGAFILNATTWLFGAYSDGLWLTKDHGATWQNVTPKGGSGSTAGKTLVLPFAPNPADGKYYLPAMEGILQSTGTDGLSWTLLPNSGGRSVGLVIGDGKMYSSDQWSNSYRVASEKDPTTWAKFPPPADLPADQGAPYLALDAVHHVLYSSNFAAGLWRVVTQ